MSYCYVAMKGFSFCHIIEKIVCGILLLLFLIYPECLLIHQYNAEAAIVSHCPLQKSSSTGCKRILCTSRQMPWLLKGILTAGCNLTALSWLRPTVKTNSFEVTPCFACMLNILIDGWLQDSCLLKVLPKKCRICISVPYFQTCHKVAVSTCF